MKLPEVVYVVKGYWFNSTIPFRIISIVYTQESAIAEYKRAVASKEYDSVSWSGFDIKE